MTRPGSGSGPDDGLVPGPPAGHFATVAEWVAQLNGEPRHAADEPPAARHALPAAPDEHLRRGNGHAGPDQPPWPYRRDASDGPARRLNGHHRAPDDDEPAAQWVREWPPARQADGHPAGGTAQSWAGGGAYDAEPGWEDQPPHTWRPDGHPAAGTDRRWTGGPWVEKPRPWLDSRLDHPRESPGPEPRPWLDSRLDHPRESPGPAAPEEPRPWLDSRLDHPRESPGPEPRPWLDSRLDHPRESRGPAAPRPPRAPDGIGVDRDTPSGWDLPHHGPTSTTFGRPGNGQVHPPDHRPGAGSRFTLDTGTRWGDVPLPDAPPAPRRPETRPATVPPPATPEAVPLGADSTRLLHRYVPAREVLDREDGEPPARRPPTLPGHPPRAVVRRRRARRRLLEWPVLIVLALLSAYLIRAYVVQTFYIPSGSMHQTLLEGDRVLVNKIGYRLHEVNRGDVVVFRRPPDFPVEDEDLIKRVVALPGETVEARGRRVYVNGRPLAEPYVQSQCSGTEDFPRVTVPRDTLWVMGDNRCNSSDSRIFGPVGEDLVVGRAFVLAWPFARLSWL